MLRALANLVLLSLPSLLFVGLVLEFVVFRFVLPAAEMPVRFYDAPERMVRFDTEGPREGVFTRGRFAQLRGRWRINDAGWNSDVEYVRSGEAPRAKPLIAIVGDSFINSFQVDPEENVAAVLREQLGGGYEVYRFGIPGAPLSHYLEMSRYVVRNFAPDVLVLVVVHNDFHLSLRDVAPRPFYLQLARQGDALVEVPPTAPDRAGQAWWEKSATLRYLRTTLRSHLLAGAAAGGGQAVIANVPVDEVRAQENAVREATHTVLARLKQENPDLPILVMMDAPRLDLYAGRVGESEVRWLNELMAEACAALAIPFVDLTEHFGAVHRATGIRFESEWDSHWNEAGHREAAHALREGLVHHGLVAAPRP